ncbi:MAG: ABC transporter ATP-binding protein [Clostridia bacterium]|nr:ABC transporter ATP-binding protein [Deltaproteobacteria bacterium]
MSILAVSHVRYGKQKHFWTKRSEILRDVTFEVNEGEIFGFLGPNGAGKTTTIKTILGLLSPDAGTVTLFGDSPLNPRTRTKLGFLPERAYFPEHLDAYEVVFAHGVLSGMSSYNARARAHELIERVGLRGDTAKHPLRTYSKGMLQRVGIAQALVSGPKMVVFDEPMSGLDPIGRADVRDIMLELRKNGTTVFFSTHILSDAEMICDRVAILVGGQTRRVGRLEEVTAGADEVVEIIVRDLPAGFTGIDAPAIERRPGGVAIHSASVDQANIIIDLLRAAHVAVVEMHRRGGLEKLFLEEARKSSQATL